MAANEEGGLCFSDPRYREIREEYNTMIRFCHRYEWPLLMGILALHREGAIPNPFENDAYGECYKRISDVEANRKLLYFRKKAIRCLTYQLLMRAHFFNVILIPALFWTLFKVFHRFVLRRFGRYTDKVTVQSAQLATTEDNNLYPRVA
ncbi:MAG: hypothetical protein OXU61_05405 [Gammaproteobacteria bacterium]|nr:hypothetical protein [Gammaproteobacteria bacterium]